MGSAMMDSQGPSLSKGFPEQETGATYKLKNSNELSDHGFHKNDRILEDNKNSVPDSLFDVEVTSSSSSLLENELSITTTCADKVSEKQFVNTISEGCETEHTSADQECSFIIAHDNLEDISSHFEHGNRVNHDEEMDITFSGSEYQIGGKEIGQFLYEEEHSRINNETDKAVSNKEEHLEEDASEQEHRKQAENQKIMIKVDPNTQTISLVTGNILPTDVTTFSSEVPAILSQSGSQGSEAHFQVVTSNSMLNTDDTTSCLDVMTSPVDFNRSVILSEQQHVLLSGMLLPGGTANQAIHINVTQDTNSCVDVNAISQHEQGGGGDCSDVKGHPCPEPNCNVVCDKAHKLKLHMLSHSVERPFKCPHEGCEWAFTTSYKLKRHMRGHTGEKPFLCPQEGCGKCFTTAYNLKSHQKAHFRTDTHVCSFEGCDKMFPTAHKLKVHERRHQAENKTHRCEMEGCGKVFSAHGTLTSHMKIHNGDKPHLCPVVGCGKRFTKASKLKLHLRSHTGERPFHCKEEGCGWSFTSAYKLKRHMRKHTGERPFICTYDGCCKSFSRSSHLKTHMLVHTGEKPFVCPIEGCNKAFTAGSSLNVHLCKHTGQKPFKCDIEGCGKTYTTAANLRVHQKRHGFKTIVEELGPVSCGSATSETETEVMYTTIGAFHGAKLNVDDASQLTSVGVQFPSSLSTTTLCALVTSAGHSQLVSADTVFDAERKQSDDSEIKTNSSGSAVPTSIPQVQFVTEGLESGGEFVVRCANEEQNVEVTTQGSVEVVEGTVFQGAKLPGNFDLCITNMMSHITSEESQNCIPHTTTKTLSPSSSMPSRPSKRSITLDFQEVHPDVQFAPPAVIFQDEVKSSDTENESEILQQSPEAICTVQLPKESVAISLSQGITSATTISNMPGLPEVVPMEVDTDCNQANISPTLLKTIPPLPEVTEESHTGIKADLSSYIDSHNSPEQDGNGDPYPESTINLQDLR